MIAVFTPNGQLLRSFGSDLRQFHGEGNVLVADCRNHHIQKFTAQGQFLAVVGAKGRGPLQFYPTDIAFNTKQ